VIYQNGNTASSADIVQVGNGNYASVTQWFVANGLASIEQYGDGNLGTSFAYGDADSSIVQKGSSKFANT
jgi:hypothetical protein